MTTKSIPAQLMVFMTATCAIVLTLCVMMFAMLRSAYGDSNAVATAGIAEATRGFALLDRVAVSQAALQAALRLKDPDEIEKALGQIDATDKSVKEMAAATGASAAAIGSKFESAVAARRQSIDAFIKGDVGAANERAMGTANPAYAATQDEVRRYYETARKATAASLAENEAAAWRRMMWRFTALAIVLAAFTVYLWRMRSRITTALRRTSGELRTGASQVLSASNQVSLSSQSLSQSATEQAASLEETSASMEEMGSMTRKNAENSHTAAQVMTEVDVRVRESHQALEDMVVSMAAIKESSEKVSKIIKTIDEIAFQTNILALNAAVEAARAGEAGMGFAVVADEVRSLAHRSAQAARDTAGMIEESISRTQGGAAKVDQVSAAISAITRSVTRVKGLVDEVSIASTQQSQGIDQVTQAIAQMEKATQTTAATSEESAAASEQLKAQSETTMTVVQEIESLAGVVASEHRTPARTRAVTPKAPAPVVVAMRPAMKKSSAAEAAIPLGDTGTYGSF
jgi:methyl-accepting chemotaxis protein